MEKVGLGVNATNHCITWIFEARVVRKRSWRENEENKNRVKVEILQSKVL